jgi:diacylglycerol kinase family enzyme
MYHAFLLNENSLRDRLAACGGDIKAICEANGLDYALYTTKNLDDLRAAVEQCGARENAVYYAVGGDGTLQALVNAVDLGNSVIQYLPYGSGNNSYITFYNRPFDLKRDILSQNTFKADLGQVNGEYFVTMVGLALDAKIGANLERFRRFPISGKMKYYGSIFYSLFREGKPVNVKMTIDGVTDEKISSYISITNGPTIGGQTPMSPHSSAFDGKLNAVMAGDLSLFQMIKLFSKINKGEHLSDPHVSQYLFETLVFESADKLTYEVDGEIRAADKVAINVCKDAATFKGK